MSDRLSSARLLVHMFARINSSILLIALHVLERCNYAAIPIVRGWNSPGARCPNMHTQHILGIRIFELLQASQVVMHLRVPAAMSVHCDEDGEGFVASLKQEPGLVGGRM